MGTWFPGPVSFAARGVLFRRKAEITIIPEGDAAVSRGKTKFFPDLFRAPGGGPVPGRSASAPVPLFAWVDTTGLRSVARRGSAV